MREVITAETAGFCFGVKRAVEKAYEAAESRKKPVYTYGALIHNEEVVEDLRKHGVRVIGSFEELQTIHDSTVIIRSHGAPRSVYECIEAGGNELIDATCPFVKRIHNIAVEENAKGRRLIIIGDREHPEVRGIMGWAGSDTIVIGSKEEISDIDVKISEKLSLVAQTTCNYGNFKEIVDKLVSMKYDINYFNTVCNATQERQQEAARLAALVDVMIVVGGSQSSNTRKLYDICIENGRKAYLIRTADDLKQEYFDTAQHIGITAGASTPKHIIEEVQKYVRT